jgi:hypothetical protein
LLGDCQYSMQEDAEFRLGVSRLRGLYALWPPRRMRPLCLFLNPGPINWEGAGCIRGRRDAIEIVTCILMFRSALPLSSSFVFPKMTIHTLFRMAIFQFIGTDENRVFCYVDPYLQGRMKHSTKASPHSSSFPSFLFPVVLLVDSTGLIRWTQLMRQRLLPTEPRG